MTDEISKLKSFSKNPPNENGDQDFAVAIQKSEIVYLTTHNKTMYNAFAFAEKKTKC